MMPVRSPVMERFVSAYAEELGRAFARGTAIAIGGGLVFLLAQVFA